MRAIEKYINKKGLNNSFKPLKQIFQMRTRPSVQTASNWLSGTAIPNQDKLQILAAWLDISTQWLRFGEVSPTSKNCTKNDHKKIQFYLDDLPKKIGLLSPKQKQIIYEIVNEFLSQNE